MKIVYVDESAEITPAQWTYLLDLVENKMVTSELQKLAERVQELMDGRLESNIPVNDPYWVALDELRLARGHHSAKQPLGAVPERGEAQKLQSPVSSKQVGSAIGRLKGK